MRCLIDQAVEKSQKRKSQPTQRVSQAIGGSGPSSVYDSYVHHNGHCCSTVFLKKNYTCRQSTEAFLDLRLKYNGSSVYYYIA